MTGSGYWGPRVAAIVALAWCAGAWGGFSSGLTIVYALGIVLLLAAPFDASAGLLGMGILMTVDTVSRVYLLTGGILRWNTFNYLLLAFVFVYAGNLLRTRNIQTQLLLLFAALLALQLTLSPDLENGAQHLLNVLAPFGMLALLLRAVPDRAAWFWLAVVNGITAALGGLVFRLDRHIVSSNANAWSLFPLAALFSACLAFCTPLSGRKRALLFTLAAVNLGWIFLSGSRGSLFAALLSIGFLAWRLGTPAQRLAGLAALAATGAAFVLLSPGTGGQALHRVVRTFDTRVSASSRTSGRWDLAVAGWYIFVRNPLGAGTGGYPSEFVRLDREDLAFRGDTRQAHAGWVKTLVENGISGILLLAAYVGSFAFVNWRCRGAVPPIGYLTTAVLAVCLFTTEFQGKCLWFLAAGATVLLHLRFRTFAWTED